MRIRRRTAALTVLALAAAVLPVSLAAAAAGRDDAPAGECTDWSRAVDGASGRVPGALDANATYWAYDVTAAPGTALRLDGRFPYARYASLTVYDGEGATVARVFDRDIEPAPGSANPFRPGVPRDTPRRDFSFALVREGDPAPPGVPTVLRHPAAPEKVSVLWRVYLPDAGRDASGGVPVPSVRAVDATTGAPAACPQRRRYGFDLPGRPDLPAAAPRISLYRVSGDRLQGNAENPYLTAPLDPGLGDVAVLRFRLPVVPATLRGGGALTGAEQARYESLCVVARPAGTTKSCLADERMRVAPDGTVTVLVGPDRLDPGRGNYLSWTGTRRPQLLVRQLLPAPAFAGSFTRVPLVDQYDPAQTWAGNEAERFVGAYAPTGRYCTAAELRSGRCTP